MLRLRRYLATLHMQDTRCNNNLSIAQATFKENEKVQITLALTAYYLQSAGDGLKILISINF